MDSRRFKRAERQVRIGKGKGGRRMCIGYRDGEEGDEYVTVNE